MTIAADAAILFFGTQDAQHTGTPGTIANNAFSGNGDTITSWANDDDAPLGSAVLKLQFDTTAPTVGSVGLYAMLLNIEGTNDAEQPDANNPVVWVGSFPLDFGVAADVDYRTMIPLFQMPAVGAAQAIQWYLKNEGSNQTMGADWEVFITPITHGPHA